MNTPIFRVSMLRVGPISHVRFADALAWTFGGYTAHGAQGGWVGANGEIVTEPVTVYEVSPIAFDPIAGCGQDAWSRFVGLCRIAGTELAQDAIYVTNSETGAQIIELKKEKAHA